MPQIVTIGEALVEVMREERDQPLDRPGRFCGPFPSGAPAIFASAAARLGADVGFVGTIGHDAFGDCIERRLLADGIDCRALRRVVGLLTGIAFVAYRSDGSRSFVFHLPQSAAARVGWEQIPNGYLDDVSYLHIMGSALSISDSMRDACYRAARYVHARGGQITLDPNLRPELMPVKEIRAVCEPILELASIVLPSGEELMALTGAETPEDGAALLLERGVQWVALKQGARGSTVFGRREDFTVPAYSVREVDPTGAGDCYDAAFIVGLSEGWDIVQVARFANAVGALATTQMGPMEGAVTRDQAIRFMDSQGRPLQTQVGESGR